VLSVTVDLVWSNIIMPLLSITTHVGGVDRISRIRCNLWKTEYSSGKEGGDEQRLAQHFGFGEKKTSDLK
jgi:hypothetical protein